MTTSGRLCPTKPGRTPTPRCTCGRRSSARLRWRWRRRSITRWAVALQLTPRGLSTRTLPHGDAHVHDRVRLHRRTSSSSARPTAICDRCRSRRARSPILPRRHGHARRDGAAGEDLADAGRDSGADPLRQDDTVHRTYDPEYAHRCWRILLAGRARIHRARCRVHRQVQPGAFLLGRFDLAVTRFSGTAGAAARRARRSCARRIRTR